MSMFQYHFPKALQRILSAAVEVDLSIILLFCDVLHCCVNRRDFSVNGHILLLFLRNVNIEMVGHIIFIYLRLTKKGSLSSYVALVVLYNIAL